MTSFHLAKHMLLQACKTHAVTNAKDKSSKPKKESEVSNKHLDSAEKSQGSEMNKGPQLNMELGVSNEQGVPAEQGVRSLKWTRGPS